MARVLVILLAAAAIVGVAMLMRARRRNEVPELNKHPERLDQMLDKTDDA